MGKMKDNGFFFLKDWGKKKKKPEERITSKTGKCHDSFERKCSIIY